MAQKTILQIVQALTAEVGLPIPTGIVSSQDPNLLKLLALVRAQCDDLLADFDWQTLQTRSNFSTASGTPSYSFPTDIKRFIGGSFYDQNNRWAMTGPMTPIEWEQVQVSGLATSPFTRFRVYDDQIWLYPTPGATVYTFVFEYISNNYVSTAGGVLQPDFTQDSDICRFDHRVVIYGTKLKFLASLNLDTTAAAQDYIAVLASAKGSNVPPRPLSITGGGTGTPLISVLNIPDTGFGT